MMLLALGGAFTVVISLGGFLHLSNKYGNRMIKVSILLIAILIALSTAISGRDLSHVGESITNLYGEDAGGGAMVTKVLTWTIVLMLIGVLLDRLIRFRFSQNPVKINYGWIFVFLIFALSNGVISSFFGTYPSFSPGLLYPLFFLLVLSVDQSWDLKDLITSIKTGLVIIFLFGFALAAVKPSLVFEGNAAGSFSILPFRYWGATPHANAAGSIAVLYLFLEVLSPTRKTIFRFIGISAAIITIILSQSKTALIGFVFCLGCIWLVPSTANLEADTKNNNIKTTLKLLSILLIPTVIYIIISIGSHDVNIDRIFGSDTGKSVTTLTGRTRIWEVALREWENNQIFGYGPNLFNTEHRMRAGMPFAFHAHNQFIQSLAQSGLIGLAGLLLLLISLSLKLISRTIATRGISLALLIFLFIRCITEVPLRSGNMISGEYIYLLAIVAIAMSSHSSLIALCEKDANTRRSIA